MIYKNRYFTALILAVAALIFASCQTYRYVKIQQIKKTVLDQTTGLPVPGAEIEVLVYRLDKMDVELTRTVQADHKGRFEVPAESASGYALPGTGLQSAPREQSYWIRQTGYLPLHMSLWAIRQTLLKKPGDELLLSPIAGLPEEVAFTTEFSERADQSMFVPSTRLAEGRGIGLLGVRGFLPFADVFERCECEQKIVERLDGAKLTVQADQKMGPFIEWPDNLMVHLAFEDGTDVGAWLIGQGLAVVDFRFDHDLREEYDRLEDEAAEKSLGVWGPLKALGKKE